MDTGAKGEEEGKIKLLDGSVKRPRGNYIVLESTHLDQNNQFIEDDKGNKDGQQKKNTTC